MRDMLRRRGSDISWRHALGITGVWFLVASSVEVAVMPLVFGAYWLWLICFVRTSGSPGFLAYVLVGTWVVVIGHLAAMVAASVKHKSWKIAILYGGIPLCIGIAMALWIAAAAGNMMAA